MAMRHTADDDGRARIREDLDRTLVVEAAAGTGKTTELVNRILRVLAEGRAEIHEIVAVTFTEKAAGELKLRLRQDLERERAKAADPVVADRMNAAVQQLEEAHVSTIHGFCADLLRERPVEARIDPLFRVLTESQAEALFRDAFSAWFQARLAEPPEGVRRSLRRASRGFRPGDVDEDGPIERLRRAGFELTQWRDFRAAWRRPAFDRDTRAAECVALVHTVAELTANPSYVNDNLFVDTAPVRRVSRDLQTRTPASSAVDQLDTLEAQLVDLRRNRDFKRARKGSGPGYRKGVDRARVVDARDRLAAALDQFERDADADLAARLHDELVGCVDEYEQSKTRAGALDFLDLLLKARDLVRDHAPVRQHFQARIKRIFVDEFQDTDPLQAELLLLLAADDPAEKDWRRVCPVPGKLFLVGDPKQSIYRFRRADVAVYQDVCTMLVERGAARIELRRSFRAVPNIQAAVNAAFARAFGQPGAAGPRYMALEPHRREHPGQPSLVALPVPEPYAQRYVAAKAIEKSLPDAVAAYIDWLVRHSGWTVTERRAAGARLPLEARHVCILFRRFVSYGEDVTRPYVDALDARGIRHLLVGGKAFHDREEIETLRSAMMAIEWPDDQLSVFATLRGPLFAISDEDLFEYHHLCGAQHSRGEGRFHPFRIPDALPAGLHHVREALQLLATLHRRRNRVPVADTIAVLLERTRAHVGFVLRAGGEQALANVLHVSELARQYELDGGMSFRGFVTRLQDAAASGQAAEAPILEEGADGVRLMTVHKAKGLEFPVVILADMTARLTPYEPGRYLAPERGLCALRIGGWSPLDLLEHREDERRRETEEAERVAYVAATRARDLLVVPAVGDEPYAEGWIAPLNAAIYPGDEARRSTTPEPGFPTFASGDSVLARPTGDPASSRTVRPGLHRLGPIDGRHTCVWWAPGDLALGAQPGFGLRRDDLIVKDVAPGVLEQYRGAYDAWRAAREDAVVAARQPSLDIMTVSDASARELLPEYADIAVTVESVGAGGRQPGGRRFGTFVHALLSDMPLGEGVDQALPPLAAVHKRLLGASDEEETAALALVRRALVHPILQSAARAAAAGRCYRETPVTLRIGANSLVEGHADLAFDTGEEFIIVDFKTDREVEAALERYRRQVQIYAAAIAQAAGRPARGVLLLL